MASCAFDAMAGCARMSTKYVLLLLVGTVHAQLRGHLQVEEHPSLIVHECTKAGGCIPHSKSVVIDANWRWIHKVNESVSCFDSNAWSKSICPNVENCTNSCAIEGIGANDYNETYGVTTSGAELRLEYISKEQNVGSRLYLLDNSSRYTTYHLKNREFSMDVDVSTLPCGVNGAVYFVQMDADGGRSRYATNEAGAEYGVGYCDAQCPRDLHYINGEANVREWGPVPGVPHSGVGRYGSCCVEMDVWSVAPPPYSYPEHHRLHPIPALSTWPLHPIPTLNIIAPAVLPMARDRPLVHACTGRRTRPRQLSHLTRAAWIARRAVRHRRTAARARSRTRASATVPAATCRRTGWATKPSTATAMHLRSTPRARSRW